MDERATIAQMKTRLSKSIIAGLLCCLAPAVAAIFGSARATSPAPVLEFKLLKELRPLPELRFVDGTGQERTIADFRGKTVLLNIWATWCAPCRKEMPSLDRLQATLGGADFQVIALSVDAGGVQNVRHFYDQLGLKNLSIFVDQSGWTMQSLRILGLPTSLLVDREGREIGRTLGPADWDQPYALSVLRRYVERFPPPGTR